MCNIHAQVFLEIDAALSHAVNFIEVIAEEEERLFTVEGQNAGMARITEAMCTCFDWGFLTTNAPRVAHINAFRVLVEMLVPTLKYCEWPSLEEFPEVRHYWPSSVEAGSRRVSYLVALCARVV